MTPDVNAPVQAAAPQDTLRRFLVVGCGGTGAQALAFMMDQLRADLRSRGINKLPEGWQFVLVDNCLSPDSGGGVPDVLAAGGTFVGLGVNSMNYAGLDGVVSRRFGASGRLGDLATWLPKRPNEVEVPIALGAGQFRTVGRVMTVAKLQQIRAGLAQAWSRVQSQDAHSSMAAMSAFGAYSPQNTPLVLVVASMSGGSGASMSLDVCRVLSMLPNVTPGSVGVFMAGPDVFDDIDNNRAGIQANGLAMLGEIVATQLGAATESDVSLYRAAGMDGMVQGVPFARVFPVGRHMGIQQTAFGNAQGANVRIEVYRGIARGLSALMLSPKATQQYESYDLGNPQGLAADRSLMGWGAGGSLEWGSFGFASLSMGRDRYAEYAAQRLARGAVDHLLDGHLANATPGETGEVALMRLADSQWLRVEQALPLFTAGAGMTFGSWLTSTLWPLPEVESVSAAITDTQLRGAVPRAEGSQATQWGQQAKRVLDDSAKPLSRDAADRARRWVWAYQRALAAEFEATISDAVSTHGLAYALEVTRRVETSLMKMADEAVQSTRKDMAPTPSFPKRAQDILDTVRHNVIQGDQNIVSIVIKAARDWAMTRIYGEATRLLAKLWPDFVQSVVHPLRDGLTEQSRLLADARGQQYGQAGLAMLHSESYVDWPSPTAQLVPRRFDEATNEVLLTTSQDYQGAFKAHVLHEADSELAVVRQVIQGVWRTGDGTPPPGGLISSTRWVPTLFFEDLDTGAVLVPRAATFEVHTRPGEVLQRAKEYVERPQQSFDQFISQSLRSYVNDSAQDQYTLGQRRAEVATKFHEALTFALPLAAPNTHVVGALYNTAVQYTYKFSEIPFQGDPLAAAFDGILLQDPMVTPSSAANMRHSLSISDSARRIDIFGSYPNYAAVCFDSILTPIRAEWASLTPVQRDVFWTMRRTRPLPACLPCGDAERRAMVAGWFVGQIVGKLDIPGTEQDGENETVRVFDSNAQEWVSFPDPRLTPFRRMRQRSDWLPSVLESMLIAVMNVGEGQPFESLRPFRVLRGLFDSSPYSPSDQGFLTMSCEVELASWLAGQPGPIPSRVDGAPTASTIDERVVLMKAFLTERRKGMTRYQDGPMGAITLREVASATPVIRDLVADILWALDAIERRIELAANRAATVAFERIEVFNEDAITKKEIPDEPFELV